VTVTAIATPTAPAASPAPAEPSTPRNLGRRRPLRAVDVVQRIIGYALLVLLALFCLVPFAWVVLSSVDADAGAVVKIPEFSFVNFARFFTDPQTPLLLINSLVIAISSTALNLVLGIAGGYALSRFVFPGRRFFMFGILLIRVIPAPATIVALYLIMVNLQLANTLHGLIIVQAVSGLPVTLWLMKGTVDAVPVELEEAAWTDGNTRLQAIRRIVLPVIGPGLGAAAMLQFMGSWGDFLTPLVLLQNQDLYPLAIGLFRAFTERNIVDWGLLAASGIVYVLPPAILYLFVRKHLLRSSLGGALKG
jgi:multiple sugar transport system permease protein